MVIKSTKPKQSRFSQSLTDFIGDFEKSFGVGTLRCPKKAVPYSVISTGSVSLDIATGVGGYVEGRIHELWGNPDAGKSSLALLGCVEAQAKYPDRGVAFIDVENKFDTAYAQSLGVDTSRLALHVPVTAEDVSDSVKKFLQSPLFSMVVIDSVGAMMSRVEQEKNADDDVIATTARIVTRMVKHATAFAPAHGAVVLIINQPRSNIARFGADTTTSGGFALKHCTTMKFKVSGTDKSPIQATVKGNRIPIGKEISIKVERNKCAPAGAIARPFLVSVATLKHGPMGIDKATEAFDVGTKTGLIARSGAKYTIVETGEFTVGQDNLVDYLRANPDVIHSIRDTVIASTAPAAIEEAEEVNEEREEAEYVETLSEAPQVPSEPPFDQMAEVAPVEVVETPFEPTSPYV